MTNNKQIHTVLIGNGKNKMQIMISQIKQPPFLEFFLCDQLLFNLVCHVTKALMAMSIVHFIVCSVLEKLKGGRLLRWKRVFDGSYFSVCISNSIYSKIVWLSLFTPSIFFI